MLKATEPAVVRLLPGPRSCPGTSAPGSLGGSTHEMTQTEELRLPHRVKKSRPKDYVVLVWRDMMSNDQFNLYADNSIYLTGPTNDEVGQHGTFEGKLTEPVSAFLRKLRDDQGSIILYVDRDLEPQSSSPRVPGRRWIWAKWIQDGEEHYLKSDRTIRAENKFTVLGRLPPDTSVPAFIAQLRKQGHTILFVHKKFASGEEGQANGTGSR